MRLHPGSFAWLLAHDLRLNWRRVSDLAAGLSPAVSVLIGSGLVVVAHVIGAVVAVRLGTRPFETSGTTTAMVVMVALVVWMIAHGLFATARTIVVRGDLDLLLGSPLSPRRVLAAKLAAIAAGNIGSVAVLMLPLANAGALIVDGRWLLVYPLLLAFGLIATAIAVAIGLAMFLAFGSQRARNYTQFVGAGIGGIFVLGAQVVAVLPPPMRVGVDRYLEKLSQQPLVRLPGEALHGSWTAAGILVAIGLMVFAAAVAALGPQFAAATVDAAGDGGSSGRSSVKQQHTFIEGLAGNLRRKEWRLLRRDPSVFAQLALQIIYTIPIAVVLLRDGSLPTVLALAPTLVVIAAQVSASLAWLTVSGEDAPELIATAPVTVRSVERSKLTAVALPVAVVIGLPVLGLAIISPRAAALSVAVAAAAATSTALLNFWHPMPGSRRGMLRRHSQSKIIALVEHLLAILWATAIVLCLTTSWAWMVPVAVALAVLKLSHRAVVPVRV